MDSGRSQIQLWIMPPEIIIEADRLLFMPFAAGDLGLFRDLHSDPEVQRFMSPDGLAMPEEIAREQFARQIETQARYGFSKWKLCLKDGRFIGRAGLSPFERTNEVELGYVLKQDMWGHGFATEAAAAVARWAFTNLQIDHVIAFTHPQNTASQRVLQKVGMSDLGPRDMGFEQPARVFRLDRQQAGDVRSLAVS